MSEKLFLDTITDKDIKEIGLKVLSRYIENGKTSYIQIVDSDSILDDESYTCHFEILQIARTNRKCGHEKNKIYIEVHFENEHKSIYFEGIIKQLVADNNELEQFQWRKYCPSIRIKNGFNTNQKEEILSNLKKLKSLVLRTILNNYENCLSDEDAKWESNFIFNSNNGKANSDKRDLKEFSRDAKEITVIHENIKKQLIKKLKEESAILGDKYKIDMNSITEEHPINKINFIDVVAKTTNKETIFFEIKTAASARLCIRQALGQLMEYAYYPNVNWAQKLVVVGTGKKDDNIKAYIKKLNTDFHINIDYLSV